MAALVCLAACGDSGGSGGSTTAGDVPVMGTIGDPVTGPYEQVGSLQVPPRTIADPGLPDSCTLLAAAEPEALITEPIAPVVRMTNVCIAHAVSSPTFEYSLSVELRRPEPVERASGPQPSNEDAFWVAEGGGIDLVGGLREELKPIEGIGDYAVWYPITDGMALHAYWQSEFILAINVRGVPTDRGLTWAQEVARDAIERTAALAAVPGATPSEPNAAEPAATLSEPSAEPTETPAVDPAD
jgi:hypothetical protein